VASWLSKIRVRYLHSRPCRPDSRECRISPRRGEGCAGRYANVLDSIPPDSKEPPKPEPLAPTALPVLPQGLARDGSTALLSKGIIVLEMSIFPECPLSAAFAWASPRHPQPHDIHHAIQCINCSLPPFSSGIRPTIRSFPQSSLCGIYQMWTSFRTVPLILVEMRHEAPFFIFSEATPRTNVRTAVLSYTRVISVAPLSPACPYVALGSGGQLRLSFLLLFRRLRVSVKGDSSFKLVTSSCCFDSGCWRCIRM